MGWVHTQRERPAGTPGPKPIVDEWRFVPESIDEARDLYVAIVDKGVPPSRARQIVAWLIVLTPDREYDVAADSTRRDYRRALADLGAPPWELVDEAPEAAGVG